MKVLIVSDTHGREKYLTDTLQRVKPIDLLIHLGDFEGGEKYIKSIAPCPVEFVLGNNDYFTGLPKEKLIQIGNNTVMLTHGHLYGVNYNTSVIRKAALKNHADIVMFGHTHIPLIDLNDDIWLINPGSLALPRQRGRIPTFIIMDIDSRGETHFTLNYVKK
jgi:putative phosphoesterase